MTNKKFNKLPRIYSLQLVNNANRVLNRLAIEKYNNKTIEFEQLATINDDFKASQMALDTFLKDFE